jgi:glycosyltransferase involved in cell wall biosynthesis
MTGAISVVIPTYNHGAALPALFDSLRAQTDQEFEAIVVDDGSTDDTEAIVRRYVRSHDEGLRIRYLSVRHGGAPAARNAGARQARGEYLLFADADLILRPDMLEQLRTALERHPEAAYAYCRFRFGWKLFRSRPFDDNALRRNNYIHTTALIRRRHFPGFDERLERFQDWDLWLTVLEAGARGVFVPRELFRARVTRVGISSWRPRAWYAAWRLISRHAGFAPAAFRRYEAARIVVQRKHGLV